MATLDPGWITDSTYFVTASTANRKLLLQSLRTQELFMHVLYHYAREHKYLLHEFVMPDHFHLLITPKLPLERAMQLIKGGFSYRAKHELGVRTEIWQASYYDRRVRDEVEYDRMKHYIHANPVRRGLVSRAEDYVCSSANPKWLLDEVPQRLKPNELVPA